MYIYIYIVYIHVYIYACIYYIYIYIEREREREREREVCKHRSPAKSSPLAHHQCINATAWTHVTHKQERCTRTFKATFKRIPCVEHEHHKR